MFQPRFLGALLTALLISTFSIYAAADEAQSESPGDAILLGHNVTPSTELPAPGVWTVGTYAVGVGLPKSFFVATSPWIWASYNTANLHLKWSTPIDSKTTFGIFASYFESYPSAPVLGEVGGSTSISRPPQSSHPAQGSGLSTLATAASTKYIENGRYQWKSQSVHFLGSYKFSPDITFYGNIHFGYFWNDDFPYSIRMDPGRDDIRGQVDITTLTQFRIRQSRYYWLLELGTLGANYVAPYLHFGNSLAYLGRSWLVQIGASSTLQFGEVFKASGWTPGRYDTREHTTTSGESYHYRYLQTALHPEFQLQYFF